MKRPFAILASALALSAACSRDAAVSVRILAPQEGAAVAGPDVTVRLEARGIEIAPVADARTGTGHHHLFLNVDAVGPGEPVPVGQEGIIHLGGGQSEHTFTGLAPGSYRVIAVIADLAHVSLDPLATDTVRFTVR
jgi:hypothetical protein